MSETVTIARNAVIAKLHNPSREAKLALQQILTYKVFGAEETALFKSGRWDGKSSFFDFRSGTFPAGFTAFVAAHLSHRGFAYNIVQKPLPGPLGPENPKVDNFPDDPRYAYQTIIAEKLLKYGQMIARVATGGGKSRLSKIAYARINRPTLFLTTRSILMYQMRDSFEKDMGVPVSVLGDGQFGHTIIDEHGNERQAVKKMCVGMVQTLVSNLKEPDRNDSPEKQQAQRELREKTIRLLSKFEFVIGEEAHEASGNSYYEILQHCKNAHYRLALTATPFMKDDEESNMRLMAAFGPIGHVVSEEELINLGILATPHFKIVQLKQRPPRCYKTTGWQQAYRYGIVENDERNIAIVYEVARGAQYGLTAMVLVQRKEHGAKLQELFGRAGLRSAFIFGENDHAERQRELNRLKNGELDVLIGSTILDVGVDVPAVGMVVLAGGGKAEVALRQRIGRGLRAKKSGPNVALVVDFSDQFNNHLHKHAAQRQQIIEGTPGFRERLLAPGEDFNFVKLGLVKKTA